MNILLKCDYILLLQILSLQFSHFLIIFYIDYCFNNKNACFKRKKLLKNIKWIIFISIKVKIDSKKDIYG